MSMCSGVISDPNKHMDSASEHTPRRPRFVTTNRFLDSSFSLLVLLQWMTVAAQCIEEVKLALGHPSTPPAQRQSTPRTSLDQPQQPTWMIALNSIQDSTSATTTTTADAIKSSDAAVDTLASSASPSIESLHGLDDKHAFAKIMKLDPASDLTPATPPSTPRSHLNQSTAASIDASHASLVSSPDTTVVMRRDKHTSLLPSPTTRATNDPWQPFEFKSPQARAQSEAFDASFNVWTSFIDDRTTQKPKTEPVSVEALLARQLEEVAAALMASSPAGTHGRKMSLNPFAEDFDSEETAPSDTTDVIVNLFTASTPIKSTTPSIQSASPFRTNPGLDSTLIAPSPAQLSTSPAQSTHDLVRQLLSSSPTQEEVKQADQSNLSKRRTSQDSPARVSSSSSLTSLSQQQPTPTVVKRRGSVATTYSEGSM
jgi:hypothetical protein